MTTSAGMFFHSKLWVLLLVPVLLLLLTPVTHVHFYCSQFHLRRLQKIAEKKTQKNMGILNDTSHPPDRTEWKDSFTLVYMWCELRLDNTQQTSYSHFIINFQTTFGLKTESRITWFPSPAPMWLVATKVCWRNLFSIWRRFHSGHKEILKMLLWIQLTTHPLYTNPYPISIVWFLKIIFMWFLPLTQLCIFKHLILQHKSSPCWYHTHTQTHFVSFKYFGKNYKNRVDFQHDKTAWFYNVFI